jgi:hypothetical protein
VFTLIVNEKIFSVSSYLNIQTGEYRVEKYNHSEPAYVDHIKIIGNDNGTGDLTKEFDPNNYKYLNSEDKTKQFDPNNYQYLNSKDKTKEFDPNNYKYLNSEDKTKEFDPNNYNYWDQIVLFCPQNSGIYNYWDQILLFCLQNSGIYNYWDQILLFCPQNSGTCIIIGVKFFRSCDEKGHVSYCHRFASVVIVVISLW